jgi:hypothetical protein
MPRRSTDFKRKPKYSRGSVSLTASGVVTVAAGLKGQAVSMNVGTKMGKNMYNSKAGDPVQTGRRDSGRVRLTHNQTQIFAFSCARQFCWHRCPGRT